MVTMVINNNGVPVPSDSWAEKWVELSHEQQAEAAYFLASLTGGCACRKCHPARSAPWGRLVGSLDVVGSG